MPMTRVRPRNRLLAIWLPLAALALVILTLPHPPRSAALDPDASDTAGMSAMRIQIDPETGTLQPLSTPPVPSKALMPSLSRSTEGLTPRTLPDGSVMVDLQGRFQNATVVHKGDDGRLHVICTDDAQIASRFMEGKSIDTSTSPLPRNAEVK